MTHKRASVAKATSHNKNHKTSKSQPLLTKVKTLMAGDTTDTPALLNQLVRLIRKGFDAHASTIYTINSKNQLVLTATDGLNKHAIGMTSLNINEGFIGYVASQKRPLNIASLAKHPKFILKPETGESNVLGGCASVPLMWNNQAIGTLSIQSKTHRKFSGEVVETLETIAMVVANIVKMASPHELYQSTNAPESHLLSGIPIHHGLAQGKAFIHKPHLDEPLKEAKDPAREDTRLTQAIIDLTKEIDHLISVQPKSSQPMKAERHNAVNTLSDILSTVHIFLNDKGWLTKIRKHIEKGLTAESAIQKTLSDLENRLSKSKDPYLKDRLWDIKDISSRLIQTLRGQAQNRANVPEGGIIIVAESLGPADLLHYQKYDVQGIVLESGLQTAHIAILARSLNLPMIGRIQGVSTIIKTGDVLLMDGRAGNVVQQPSGLDKQKFADSVAIQKRVQDKAKYYESESAITADGIRISLSLNAGLIADLENCSHMDIDGIGLLRTEIPFMMQDALPDVTTQTNIYREFYSRMEQKPVKIRTLDVGGDKVLPYFNKVQEDNPMMGWRSIRIALDRPTLLKQQVRAIIRAAQGGRVDLMFPMITEISEFKRAKQIVEEEISREAKLGHLTPLDVKYGAMIEVPNLLWRLDSLIPLVDFLSVGTNDLFQFMFATDRGNPYTANHYDVLSPAFLSVLHEIQVKASKHHVSVSICGEMASRPLECLALIGLGYVELSMNRNAIGSTVRLVKSINHQNIQSYIRSLLSSSEHSIRNHLQMYAIDKQLQL